MAAHLPGPEPACLPSVLAATGGVFVDLLLPLGGLVLFIVGGFLLVAWLRRRMRAGDELPDDFTLDGLRRLHRAGDLSDEEYARARQAIIDRVRGAAGASESENAGSGGSGDDSPDVSTGTQSRQPD